ncbi:MAG TPA: methylamine dehydrogenase light chain [Candidatus Competibacteraceae bacterium]|nr:methylamine dehydrogenase light chain [Candidatus Competibacteraceae bacterium]
MRFLDHMFERSTRLVAARTSRRSALARLGTLLVGGSLLPLLPIDRVARAAEAGKSGDPGDPTACDYWRYCAIDGYLCTCCGGTINTCPPGAEPSAVTWVGTCRNPADGKDYIIAYNDCCGKGACNRCLCNRNESDEPMYRPFANNDINWCLGAKHMSYNCTVARISGVAK